MSIIEVKNLTKEYQLGSIVSLKQSAVNAFNKLTGRPIVERERFKALDDINFTIDEGEVVGIIGANGAGKSTLLKHLASITTPTKGEVIVRGSIAPLIEVGAGVNPELTGRENIFLNGAILGIPKKIIQQKLDEIIEFSELEQFIDTPVKRYSSGMTVRLGFSIATSMDADILIVDEVLAVGDLAFQRKCFDRMESMIKGEGKTVLIVSHNVRQIERLCSRTILIKNGIILDDGDPTRICNVFYEQNNKRIRSYMDSDKSQWRSLMASGEVELNKIELFNDKDDTPITEIEMHEAVRIRATFTSKVHVVSPEIVIGFHTTDFVYIASTSTAPIQDRPNVGVGMHTVECSLDSIPLVPGIYGIRFTIHDQNGRPMWYGENLVIFQVKAGKVNRARMPVLGLVDLPFKWIFR